MTAKRFSLRSPLILLSFLLLIPTTNIWYSERAEASRSGNSSGGSTASSSTSSTAGAPADSSAEDLPIVSHIGADQFRAGEEALREQMITMSRHLNVTCVACHNPKNFKDDKIPAFRTAREHMKLTQLLIENGMDGKDKRPRADCYMCHRGKLIPDYKEPLDPLIIEKSKKKK